LLELISPPDECLMGDANILGPARHLPTIVLKSAGDAFPHFGSGVYRIARGDPAVGRMNHIREIKTI